MRYLNAAQVRVFCEPGEEDETAVRRALLDLVPFSLEEEKIAVKEERALGFDDKPIRILSVELTKERHTNAFLKHVFNKLTPAQKAYLLRQAASRLDDDLCFFIRLDKDRWADDREMAITDSGRCFHLKLNLAVFPRSREKALACVESLLTQDVKNHC